MIAKIFSSVSADVLFVSLNFIIIGSVYVKQPSEVLGRISKTGMFIITNVLTEHLLDTTVLLTSTN